MIGPERQQPTILWKGGDEDKETAADSTVPKLARHESFSVNR
jgi:hypothetical protein